uniref:Uncharacterized protein n=1 Tax=Arundo donax TaxID=35708 RepID=A0A0A9H7D2_ARUDO
MEGRVRRGVAAAELHLAGAARVVGGERGVEGAARERLRIRRRRRRFVMVVVVAVVGHEFAEGLAGDLSAVEEEVEVRGQLPLGHALAEHEQHSAHHMPQPPRHVRFHHDPCDSSSLFLSLLSSVVCFVAVREFLCGG